MAGFAEVRLEAGAQRLFADLKHIRENYEDDHGNLHDSFVESFSLEAVRVGKDQYEVVRVSFDGAEYPNPERNIVELGLSIFHSRALDISILMVEQAFNKQDMLEEAELPMPKMRKTVFANQSVSQQPQSFGVVIPFRPRAALKMA